MTSSKKNIHQFQTTVIWDKETGGDISVKNYPILKIDTPIEWGGQGRSYCPDQLFISSIGGCLLDTFIFIKNRMRLNLLDLKITLNMSIRQARDGYHVKEIEGKTKVTVDEGEKEKGETCAELAKEYCHILRLIRKVIPVNILSEVNETTNNNQS
ncbi:MAG: OsmC family protein [Candidatus Jordarchaeum sp.]|uniref:OsmC family protein n=1 Tax=Candidatus Jordarchaeum sp. TaxID=2823881 RepID=UPI00404B1256